MIPIRHVARLIVVDTNDCILLVRYEEHGSSYWVPPGGALESGEDHRTAAQRELAEETGLLADIGDELWERRFNMVLAGGEVDQIERYFLVRIEGAAPPVQNTSSESIAEHRWWTRDDLERTEQTIYPEGLVELLRPLFG